MITNFFLPTDFKKSETQISYADKILLMGSCFSDNIGKKLSDYYFKVMANPNGIVFDPISLYNHLSFMADLQESPSTKMTQDYFTYQNEEWHSLWHSSSFSSPEKEKVEALVHQKFIEASNFLKTANVCIITFGTAFHYTHIENQIQVANCHKIPQSAFEKKLLRSQVVFPFFEDVLQHWKILNPDLNFIFTVSPVRHTRDGLVENNRSKAQLVELIRLLNEKLDYTGYFPAYEFQLDVLRDYRFYEADMVHPNELAINEIFELFCELHLDNISQSKLKIAKQLYLAAQHRPRNTKNEAYKKHLKHMEALKNQLTSGGIGNFA